ncbi:hypothetical protein J2S03_000110 [Alicyclobacillus cycloheptanicus]|uniref:Secreted protein n=1 Tax=Alicyclobacillus cycloheptanicus TaxID=1457 RepID=A0ABT9XDD6_9BACL|nr:hypothetical protein [Alicyclobacillus cycloheptanicus]
MWVVAWGGPGMGWAWGGHGVGMGWAWGGHGVGMDGVGIGGPGLHKAPFLPKASERVPRPMGIRHRFYLQTGPWRKAQAGYGTFPSLSGGVRVGYGAFPS